MENRTIIKCLGFAEGKQGYFRLNGIKNKNFPKSLLIGNEKQEKIQALLKKSMTTRQIAEVLECSQPNIIDYIRKQKKCEEFYQEWIEFLDFIEPIKNDKIVSFLTGYIGEAYLILFTEKGIVTIEDFLNLCVTHSKREVNIFLLDTKKTDKRSIIFTRLYFYICDKFKLEITHGE